jgi:hypothetical protein
MTQKLVGGDYVKCILSDVVYKCVQDEDKIILRTIDDRSTSQRIYIDGRLFEYHIHPQYIKCDKPKMLVKKNVKRFVSDIFLDRLINNKSLGAAKVSTEKTELCTNEIEVTYKVLE